MLTKKTSTWPAKKKKTPAMCKTGHEHAANENNTQHECTQPIKTQIACNNTKRGKKTAWPSHMASQQDHGARVSEPRHETETQDMSAGIQTPRSKHGTHKTNRQQQIRQDREQQQTRQDREIKTQRQRGEPSQCQQDSPESH